MTAIPPGVAVAFPLVAIRVVVITVLAFVTTAISLRLLGIRRGWGTALLSGILGWGGTAVAVGGQLYNSRSTGGSLRWGGAPRPNRIGR